MKKLLSLNLLLVCFILAGCTKTTKCQSNINKDDFSYNMSVDIKHDDQDIESATLKMKFDDKEAANYMCTFMKSSVNEESVKCDETTVTVEDYDKTVSDEDGELTVDDFIKSLEEKDFTCK